MSYLVLSLPGKKKELKGESKGGLDPKKGKRKRIGKEGFLSYHVISKRGWGVFFAFFPKPQPHLTHEDRERDEEEKKKEEEEEEKIKGFEFAINSRRVIHVFLNLKLIRARLVS